VNRENVVPIVIAGILPYRLVFREDDTWQVDLNDINYLNYDYVKLHRLSGTLNICIDPLFMTIGFDGSLILPVFGKSIKKITYQKIFNSFLGKLLFGGIFFEAISPEDICLGQITKEGYYRYNPPVNGLGARIHYLLQEVEVSSLEAIRLWNPQIIKLSSIESAYKKGNEFFKKFPKISIDLILNGITYLIKWEWSQALIFIWTSIEQTIDQIWYEEVYDKRNERGEIPKRKNFLEDTRTWTTSARIELFYQMGLFNPNIYILFNKVRQARNNFIHEGNTPEESDAMCALDLLMTFLSLKASDYKKTDDLDEIQELIKMYVRNGLFPEKKEISDNEVIAWREIRPIPGYENWGDKKFEKVDGFAFKKIPREKIKRVYNKSSSISEKEA